MTFEPLLAASPVIQLHAFAALLALILTPVQLIAPKGTASHRLVGYIWVTAMLIVAISSFRIHTIRWLGPWSPIHLLSLWTVVMLPLSVWLARRGEITRHRRAMLVFVIGALGIAGAFTLMPGRIMHAVVFGI